MQALNPSIGEAEASVFPINKIKHQNKSSRMIDIEFTRELRFTNAEDANPQEVAHYNHGG